MLISYFISFLIISKYISYFLWAFCSVCCQDQMSSSSDWLIFKDINQKEIIDIMAATISDVLEAGLHNQL